jgi:hypothetical protein
MNQQLKHTDRFWTQRSTLRAYINSLDTYPFPRRRVIDNPFFGMLVRDVVALSPEALELEIRYIVGLGPLGRRILIELIGTLSKSGNPV